jgi:hypothetical protein
MIMKSVIITTHNDKEIEIENHVFTKCFEKKYIQGVSEISVLILTNGRTRQFMKLFCITFLRKSIIN